MSTGKKQPRYQSIAADLLERAHESSDGNLPPQRELALHYGVTRVTIRQALGWLAEKGLAEKGRREQGGARRFRLVVPRRDRAEGHDARMPVVGMPLWVDSIADLEPLRMLNTFGMIKGAREGLRRFGMELEVFPAGFKHKPTTKELLRRKAREWSAVILSAARGQYDEPFMRGLPFPERRRIHLGMMEGGAHNCVYPDFYQGMELAMRELSRLGARRILYTSSEKDRIPHLLVRGDALERAAASHGGMTVLYAGDGNTVERAYSSVKRCLMEGLSFDAVLGNNSYAALGALRALADSGITVPQDLPVIAFGVDALNQYLVPRLSAVSCDSGFFGREAARMAVELIIKDLDHFPNIIFPVHWLPGETTAFPEARTTLTRGPGSTKKSPQHTPESGNRDPDTLAEPRRW